jgi:DNA repair exonuclease SbcCD ATPase subunit
MVNSVTPQLRKAREKLDEELAERDFLKKRLKEEEVHLREVKKKEESFKKIRVVFQKAATMTQKQIEFHISNIVSTALAAIWDDPYKFELEFVPKRGKTEANLWFVRDENKMHPMDNAGGGAIDVASMALRIAAWSLNKNTRPIIILDEPFKNLSAGLQPAASDMLKMLSEKLGLQIIMVSHIQELTDQADKQIVVKRVNGISVIGE